MIGLAVLCIDGRNQTAHHRWMESSLPPTDRLDLSDRVITTWEAMGSPPGTPSFLIKMVENELVILGTLVEEDPERVQDLIKRYERVATNLKTQIA